MQVIAQWLPSVSGPDLLWLVAAVMLAGLVRGFAGFGTGMVFVPLAALVLPPVWVVLTIVVFDLIGPLPLVPESLRRARRVDLGMLVLGLVVCAPAGALLLTRVEPTVFQWGVSGLTLVLLAVLVSGWRFTRYLSKAGVAGVGGLGGFLGGVAALPGPPVILLYMSGPGAAAEVRATVNLYLILFDAMLFIIFAAFGMLILEPMLLGALLIAPYMAACWLGACLFKPERERLFRLVAYGLIGFSALYGMPFDGN